MSMWISEMHLFVRVLIAAFLGLLIGLERQHHTDYASAKVYVIFAMGTALFTIVSSDALHHTMGKTNIDITRISGQIVSGIGFICAAFIFKEQFSIHGLTSSVTLWSTAAIGMSCGYGMHAISALSTLMMLIVLMTMLSKKQPNETKKATDFPSS